MWTKSHKHKVHNVNAAFAFKLRHVAIPRCFSLHLHLARSFSFVRAARLRVHVPVMQARRDCEPAAQQ